ncbi:hypothetical protein SAMN02799624_01743 [Paenibacillus sp. UNC496MF]|nr:hypothetical protein SAMN02799624_01743 [Paenibacillus sp. UNC496MF]
MNVRNKWMPALLLMLLLVFSMMPAGASVKAHVGEKTDSACLSPKMVQLQGDLRKLWIDHAIWTKKYVISALANLPDQKEILARLLQNQQDIGNAFKPYYGEEAGNKLAELLREHILLAGKIVAAAKAGNQADMKKLDADWHRNADDIAEFLSGANPNWKFKDLQEMLYTHLQLLTDQIVARIKNDWKGDIEAYDKYETQIIHMADAFTEGIVKQFPGKF